MNHRFHKTTHYHLGRRRDNNGGRLPHISPSTPSPPLLPRLTTTPKPPYHDSDPSRLNHSRDNTLRADRLPLRHPSFKRRKTEDGGPDGEQGTQQSIGEGIGDGDAAGPQGAGAHNGDADNDASDDGGADEGGVESGDAYNNQSGREERMAVLLRPADDNFEGWGAPPFSNNDSEGGGNRRT